MASIVKGAFFLEGTDSEEEDDDDGAQDQIKTSHMSQDFEAFAARMQSLGYREQSGLLSETASQNSFNEGFGDAAGEGMENGFVEGRRHAKKLFGESALEAKPVKGESEQPLYAKTFLGVGLGVATKKKGGGAGE